MVDTVRDVDRQSANKDARCRQSALSMHFDRCESRRTASHCQLRQGVGLQKPADGFCN